MKKLSFGVVTVLAIAIVAAVVSANRDGSPAPAVPDTGNTPTRVEVTISPTVIHQGEPAMVVINGTSTLSSLTWNGKRVDTFTYENRPTAFIGIDLKMKAGSYPIVATLQNGEVVRKNLVVTAREAVSAPLGIPDKLGGNTPQAEQQLVSTLASENTALAAIPTTKARLWTDDFRYPLSSPFITDQYGYTRLTGASTISHKGTDFRAPVGTKVYAMNRGEVALVRNFRNYGNTIVIDHGFGLQTLYMHLSETNVKQGEEVAKGQIIGKSGMTGYAEQPHLHISLKINGISIDPVKFIELF